MTREEVIAQNPWVEVAKKIQECIDTKDWYCESNGGFICEEDRSIIEAHNNRCDKSKSKNKERFKYVTDLVTGAHSGNVLDAKIIILTLNPGYSELIDRKIFGRLNDETKAIMYRNRINALTFNAKKMLDSEEECILGNAYWYEQLSSFWEKENIDEELVLERIAILQSVGYKSSEFTEFNSKKDLLGKAHVERIIKYIAENNSDCLFIIARKSVLWEMLLKKNNIAVDRIIKLKNPRNSTISIGNMQTGTDYSNNKEAERSHQEKIFEKILRRLKKTHNNLSEI